MSDLWRVGRQLVHGLGLALACYALDVHTAYCRGWVHCRAYRRHVAARRTGGLA